MTVQINKLTERETKAVDAWLSKYHNLENLIKTGEFEREYVYTTYWLKIISVRKNIKESAKKLYPMYINVSFDAYDNPCILDWSGLYRRIYSLDIAIDNGNPYLMDDFEYIKFLEIVNDY